MALSKNPSVSRRFTRHFNRLFFGKPLERGDRTILLVNTMARPRGKIDGVCRNPRCHYYRKDAEMHHQKRQVQVHQSSPSWVAGSYPSMPPPAGRALESCSSRMSASLACQRTQMIYMIAKSRPYLDISCKPRIFRWQYAIQISPKGRCWCCDCGMTVVRRRRLHPGWARRSRTSLPSKRWHGRT